MIPKIMRVAHKGSGGQKGYIHHTEGIVGACTATDYKDPKHILEFTGGDEMSEKAEIIVMGLLDTKNQEMNRRVYDTNGVAPTLTACGGGGTEKKILDPKNYRVRKLTPTEYGRLQGFPMDSWEQVVSNSQAYKQFGNAVTVNVARAIATAIYRFLGKQGG